MHRARPTRGAALYASLGFAVFVFFLVTALTARVQYNLRLVEGAADRTRLLYVAQGGCNEVIARLNLDPPLTLPTRQSPYRRSEGATTVEVWVEDDPTNSNVRHVRARAASSGGSQEFERVVTRRPEVNPVFFTTGMRASGDPTSVFRNVAGSPDWDLLPPVPNFTAEPDGTLTRRPGFSMTIHGISADREGNAYSVTAPPIQDDVYGPMFRQMHEAGVMGLPRMTENYLLFGQMVEQVSDAEAARVLNGARPVLAKYSGQENSWSALPPPPEVRLTQTGEFETVGPGGPGFLLQPTAGANQDQLFVATIRQGQDSIQQLQGSSSWRALPAPPAKFYAGPQGVMEIPGRHCQALLGLSASPEGTLFSQWARDRTPEATATSGLFRYDSQARSWTILPPPPRQYGEVSIPPFQMLGQMQAGPRGTLYMTFFTPPTPPGYPEFPPVPDQVISYSPATGSWTLVTPPPATYYDASGNLVPGPPRTKIDSLGIDADGGLLVKYPQLGAPHTVYRREREYAPLPPVPRVGHSHTGERFSEPGFLSVQANVTGGGVPTGATRYVPTASY